MRQVLLLSLLPSFYRGEKWFSEGLSNCPVSHTARRLCHDSKSGMSETIAEVFNFSWEEDSDYLKSTRNKMVDCSTLAFNLWQMHQRKFSGNMYILPLYHYRLSGPNTYSSSLSKIPAMDLPSMQPVTEDQWLCTAAHPFLALIFYLSYCVIVEISSICQPPFSKTDGWPPGNCHGPFRYQGLASNNL